MVYWMDFVNFSQPWFYGKDIVIDLISLAVVLITGWFCLRNYMIDRRNSKQLLLAAAFLLLSGSLLIKVITNVLTHAENAFQYHAISAIGFLAHLSLMLFGFYVLYALTSRDNLTMNYVIMAYFILIMTYFARFNYHWFHVTAVIFLGATTRRYFLSYTENKYRNTLLLAASFAIITLSQVFFTFTHTERWVYIAAELIQLAGYMCLAYTLLQVLENAGKKNKN